MSLEYEPSSELLHIPAWLCHVITIVTISEGVQPLSKLRHQIRARLETVVQTSDFKRTVFLKMTNTDPFAAWFVVTGDATPDGIRVVWLVLRAISSLPSVASAGALSLSLGERERVLH